MHMLWGWCGYDLATRISRRTLPNHEQELAAIRQQAYLLKRRLERDPADKYAQKDLRKLVGVARALYMTSAVGWFFVDS